MNCWNQKTWILLENTQVCWVQLSAPKNIEVDCGSSFKIELFPAGRDWCLLCSSKGWYVPSPLTDVGVFQSPVLFKKKHGHEDCQLSHKKQRYPILLIIGWLVHIPISDVWWHQRVSRMRTRIRTGDENGNIMGYVYIYIHLQRSTRLMYSGWATYQIVKSDCWI